MEERAAIKVTLPRPDPTSSYWQDPPSRLAKWQGKKDSNGKANFPKESDVIIIGSGLTGASVAYNLLESENNGEILMLEARSACSGATGRNGGHTKTHSYREFVPNAEAMGEDEAAKIVRLKYDCMNAMHDFAIENGIECDRWQGDTVDIFYNEWHYQDSMKAIEKNTSALGAGDKAVQYRLWNSEDVARVFKAPGAVGAISYDGGSMSGYKFGTGVLELGLSKGLNLWTNTPVLNIERGKEGPGWIIATSRGNVKARKVVLATNGYTPYLYPALQGVVVPLRGHMTVQRKGSGLPAGTLKTTYSFIYDDGYEYMIPRPVNTRDAGDICIGGGTTKTINAGLGEYGTTDDTTVNSDILEYLEGSTKSFFAENWGDDDPDGRLREAWTGIMGYSADGFPLVGQVPGEDGLYVSASFQGSGMVMALLCAKALTLMMDGKDDEALKSWFPDAFRMGQDRLQHKFQGRFYVTAPKDLENKAQI